ncbi:MAG: hypothetical protein CMN87_10795 [Stappia sp.]|uniref:hypothetical protein n=1 Tax=Stappia sp. TaxID=1870903 RepID=UPI000C529200|nr:hypothetical protein [Stappia sp.]MAA98682.1 hypothetical protein [Stappia sp.]MBM20488.1 hypothetical protein [Stappia sp.]
MGDVVSFPRERSKHRWVKYPSGPNGRWTREQDEFLQQWYGESFLDVSAAATLTGRTVSAVRQRVHKLGIKRPPRFAEARSEQEA